MANQVKLNINELKDFVKHIVTNNRHLQENGKIPVAINVEGDAGLGKTSAMLQSAKELGLNYVKLNLAQIEELGDLVGFPIKQIQIAKTSTSTPIVPITEVKTVTKVIEGKLVRVPADNQEVAPAPADNSDGTKWINENAWSSYEKHGWEQTGINRMSYCPPEWIADKKEGGILLLDDWTRADVRFLQAVMDLIDRQEYISWKLPKDWHIVLTSNPDNGEYNVNSIDIAQRTRFISVELKFDVDCWAKWAESAGIDGRCINFMLMHPELITASVNPRSVTTFFNSISSLPDFSQSLPLVQMIGEGSVGPEFSTVFVLFINNKLDKLVKPQDVLFHDNENYIIGELRTCMGRGGDFRADIASTLTTRIVNYALYHAETKPVDQKLIDRVIKLTVTDDLLPNDLRYFLVKRILNGNKVKFSKMMQNPEVIRIASK